ncbi:MAG: hypothetical protein UV73_C0015G0019 [Candidatus Gottesmanbacteria bacterium GW2011_GWA2_43_14]|uniref:Uncharacterized protein n=1 Tax=Candidatus Gottesmanbacteria bacterium GW2011_GWA2_43_14 TaxID=1618443 RepID=A0A0G1DDE3_9BACT|nr:MAG: hypothetical protein UV73_C0015G0019 [Candidatus Gottesmanbacteria bacterium GW2011_GWA2_43_14]
MPRLILVLFLSFAVSLFIISPVQAQPATPTGIPTCDLCGWCNRSVNPKPSDWDACQACLYTAGGLPKPHTYFTVLGCFSTNPADYVQQLLSIVFSAAGGIAFLAVLAGSGMVLTSSGNPERLKDGKDIIVSSILGILIILFAVFLLRVVGVDILNIPGFS